MTKTQIQTTLNYTETEEINVGNANNYPGPGNFIVKKKEFYNTNDLSNDYIYNKTQRLMSRVT